MRRKLCLCLSFVCLYAQNDYNTEQKQCKSYVGNGLSGLDALRLEGEHHLVVAWLDVDGSQHIVHSAYLNGVAIDCGCPTWVIHLREYHYSTLCRADIVVELVRLV